MIGNEDKLEALLLSGHNYLKRMDKRELSLEAFGKARCSSAPQRDWSNFISAFLQPKQRGLEKPMKENEKPMKEKTWEKIGVTIVVGEARRSAASRGLNGKWR